MKLIDIFSSNDYCSVCGQTPCNCTHIKESQLNEVDPRNFDSDEDYYDAVRNQGRQKFSGDWDVWDEIASLENQLRYEKSDALRYQLHKQIDQLKREYGINDEEDIAEGAAGDPYAFGDDDYMDIIQGMIDDNRRNMSPSRKPRVLAATKRYIEKNGGVFDLDVFEYAYDQIVEFSRGIDESQSVAEGSLNEFAPPGSNDGGDDGFSEETLKRLAAQWYNGDEDPRIEKALIAGGWEIGQDEGYDDEPGVFVVQSGDVNGNSYISWPAHELKQGVAEGNKKPEPPEADYGDEYQAMVARVKKLAGLGPLKTVWDPQKRVYKNIPTAEQPKK